ncbi:MAG TPA: hypothetical protein VFH14_00790, partial [Gemmatimonadaceae bacterium]|nr:hypothetical protein [Gemmatimonadaceae bacterium]
MRKGWPCLFACVAVFVAIVMATASSPASSRTSEPSLDLLSDDRAWLSIPVSSDQRDPLDCTDQVRLPALENVLVSKWSPDSNRLAVTRVITIPSFKTITGYEEDPVMSI